LYDLHDLNQAATRFMTQELDRNQCIHGRQQKLFQGGNVCAGRTSILNLLSERFSALRLSEMLFLFITCLISIFASTFYKQVVF